MTELAIQLLPVLPWQTHAELCVRAAGEKDQRILTLSAQLTAARASGLAAERRAEGLAGALAARAASCTGKDCELSAARKLAEGARQAATADKAAAAADQADNDRLREELRALSQLSSQACCPLLAMAVGIPEHLDLICLAQGFGGLRATTAAVSGLPALGWNSRAIRGGLLCEHSHGQADHTPSQQPMTSFRGMHRSHWILL